MKVFISCSQAVRDWAVKLQASLQQENIAAWLTPDHNAENVLMTKLTRAYLLMRDVQASDATIVVVGSNAEIDDRQRNELQIALESVWKDPQKRLIPFLLNDAEPPAFVRSSVEPEESLPIVRIREPERDWQQAIKSLLTILRNEQDWSQVEQIPSVTEADREEQRMRFAEISQYVETLKANLPFPRNEVERPGVRSQP